MDKIFLDPYSSGTGGPSREVRESKKTLEGGGVAPMSNEQFVQTMGKMEQLLHQLKGNPEVVVSAKRLAEEVKAIEGKEKGLGTLLLILAALGASYLVGNAFAHGQHEKDISDTFPE